MYRTPFLLKVHTSNFLCSKVSCYRLHFTNKNNPQEFHGHFQQYDRVSIKGPDLKENFSI